MLIATMMAVMITLCAIRRGDEAVDANADGGDAAAEPDVAGTWGGCPSLSEVDIYRFKSFFSFDK